MATRDISRMNYEEVREEFLKSSEGATLGAAFWQAVFADKRSERIEDRTTRAERHLERLTIGIFIMTVTNVVLVAGDIILRVTGH